MFIKTIDPESWGFSEPPAVLIKAAAPGGGAGDFQAFVKRAGHYLADVVRRISFPDDELPVHLLAVGGTEYYGPNRNADGFREKTCKTYAKTFKKYARFYRNHLNKDPRISYGTVKEALYNPEMHRIELIVGINKTKSAAERNGNLVDPRLVEDILAGRQPGVSMACRVAYDVCSWCGNRAKNRSEYCDDACSGGGLKKNAGVVLSCGHVLHADNPEPQFFDISEVTRPADRTAYITGILDKNAAHILGATPPASPSDEAPLWLPTPDVYTVSDLSLLDKLAQADALLDTSELGSAFVPAQQFLPQAQFPKTAATLTALARWGIILPLRDYLYLHTGDRQKSAMCAGLVRRQLPGVYRRMQLDGSLERFAKFAYLSNAAPTRAIYQAAQAQAPLYSLLPEYLLPRVQQGLFDPDAARLRVKQAAVSPVDNEHLEHLARCYAAYTTAALDIAEKYSRSPALTRRALLTQNRVC